MSEYMNSIADRVENIGRILDQPQQVLQILNIDNTIIDIYKTFETVIIERNDIVRYAFEYKKTNACSGKIPLNSYLTFQDVFDYILNNVEPLKNMKDKHDLYKFELTSKGDNISSKNFMTIPIYKLPISTGQIVLIKKHDCECYKHSQTNKI